VLARASSASDATVPLTRDGDRALDDERQQIVNRVVSRTGEGAPRVRARGHRTHDVELEDDGVSRTHAVVFLDVEGGASVADLMSTNGTTLNGQRVSDADLKDGDVLQVGDTRLLVGLAR
jgi:pSer/pThr/pTyr-binding forkhead associated (FHA) protein